MAVTVPPKSQVSPTTNEVVAPLTAILDKVLAALTVTAQVFVYITPLMVIEAVIVAEPVATPVIVMLEPLAAVPLLTVATLVLLDDQEIAPLLLDVAEIVVVPFTVRAADVFEIVLIPTDEVPQIASAYVSLSMNGFLLP